MATMIPDMVPDMGPDRGPDRGRIWGRTFVFPNSEFDNIRICLSESSETIQTAYQHSRGCDIPTTTPERVPCHFFKKLKTCDFGQIFNYP